MKAKAIVNKLLEAGLDDPTANLARHSADIYQQRRYGPKHLIAQPESCDAITAAHFDMWNNNYAKTH